jgi:hypothetical protein
MGELDIASDAFELALTCEYSPVRSATANRSRNPMTPTG